MSQSILAVSMPLGHSNIAKCILSSMFSSKPCPVACIDAVKLLAIGNERQPFGDLLMHGKMLPTTCLSAYLAILEQETPYGNVSTRRGLLGFWSGKLPITFDPERVCG